MKRSMVSQQLPLLTASPAKLEQAVSGKKNKQPLRGWPIVDVYKWTPSAMKTNPYRYPAAAIAEVKAKPSIPLKVKNVLNKFKTGALTHVVIRGAPTEAAGATPVVDPRRPRGIGIVERTILECANEIGIPIRYKQERDGLIIHHTTARPHKSFELSSSGSLVVLDAHVDNGHLVFARPDVLVILGVRSDPNGPLTGYLPATRLAAALPARLFKQAFKPLFATRPPKAWKTPANASPMHAIFSQAEHGLEVRFAEATEAVFPEGREVVAAIQKLTTKSQIWDWHKIEACDLICLDNRRGLHSRTAFTPSYPYARWTCRVFVKAENNLEGAELDHATYLMIGDKKAR